MHHHNTVAAVPTPSRMLWAAGANSGLDEACRRIVKEPSWALWVHQSIRSPQYSVCSPIQDPLNDEMTTELVETLLWFQ